MHYLGQECCVISHMDVSTNVRLDLWFTSSLGNQITECNHFALLKIQRLSCVVVAEAIGRKPIVHCATLVVFFHVVTKDVHLALCASWLSCLIGIGETRFFRFFDAKVLEHFVGSGKEWIQLRTGMTSIAFIKR